MTGPIDVLRTELMALAGTLHVRGVPLIVGGGYGLLLKQEHLVSRGARTVREIPQSRATKCRSPARSTISSRER